MSVHSQYNSIISRKWESRANEKQAQLFFALSATDKGQVFLFWDNARGNEETLDLLKQVVAMMEKNKQKNFGTTPTVQADADGFVNCPYCGGRHRHGGNGNGIAHGHRQPDCGNEIGYIVVPFAK